MLLRGSLLLLALMVCAGCGQKGPSLTQVLWGGGSMANRRNG